MVTGRSPRVVEQGDLAERLGVARRRPASREPSRGPGRGRRAGRRPTRRAAARSARRAAPCRRRRARTGRPSRTRRGARASGSRRRRRHRARRAAATSPRQSGQGEVTALGDRLLGSVAVVAAVDVGGRDGDEVGERDRLAGRRRALAGELEERRRHPGRTEQVDLDRAVERRVEADGGGASGRRCRSVARSRPPLGSRPRPSVADVARDRGEPAGDLVVEAVAELGAQAVEAVVAEDLAAGPLGGALAPARADEQRRSRSRGRTAAAARRARCRGNRSPR